MELKRTQLNVKVRYSAFDGKNERVLVKKFDPKGKPHFRVRIFLEGPDLTKVESVVYTLHPTFSRPRREVSSGPNFELTIWTWGTFEMRVEIFDKEGSVDERKIYLDYSNDIQIAKAKNRLVWDKNTH